MKLIIKEIIFVIIKITKGTTTETVRDRLTVGQVLNDRWESAMGDSREWCQGHLTHS